MKPIIVLLICFLSMGAKAQNSPDPAKWSFDINQVGPEDYELIFKADIENSWVIYSQDSPDGGPVPTSINFTSENVETLAEAKETGDLKEVLDEMFDMKLKKFGSAQAYVLKQRVRVKDISVPVSGYVTYMMCNNKVCLPPKDVDFSFTIKVVNPLDLGGGK